MKIYLATPYTSTNPVTVDYRVRAVNKVAADFMKAGHVVFSPISHSHTIAMENNLPTTFEFWQVQNHAFIDWADMVMILTIPGWKESKGVADEIEYARKIGCPVKLWRYENA